MCLCCKGLKQMFHHRYADVTNMLRDKIPCYKTTQTKKMLFELRVFI